MLERLSPQEWRKITETFNGLVFDEYAPGDAERIDFALVYGEGDKMQGFVTCREMDSKSIYWAYGGILPEYRGTSVAYKSYAAGLGWTRKRYERIATRVESENVHYLTMAMKMGFRVVGTVNYNGKVLVQLLNEFGGSNGSSGSSSSGNSRGSRAGKVGVH